MTDGNNKHIHRKALVKVGNYEIFAGGSVFIKPGDLEGVDVIVPLNGEDPVRMVFGGRYDILCGYMHGMREITGQWIDFVNRVIAELQKGRTVFTYCWAGHGRTGTLLASLVALLETKETSPDPVFTVRQRYCLKAVETSEQAEYIFALRGQELPPRYRERGSLLIPDDRFPSEE